ncbi:ClpP/crotonase [Glarea lozoyensis ATCC 20868]|uniref:ClpP/crotonase n=1 Tax=Glarea lozoyensis (strain ATCC 20868 / MF5171) TaxID=1116229 RepID=S3CWJ2_GLAL2|nr:ClpP/crotonase [Glarea lozoyensis ATCC 20868]EPE30025.1 ClpP/crotonase [Glarea lozoyensis ATCC 20868]
MRYFGAVLSLASVAAASCDADNCLRALRATQVPGQLQTAQAFCATFTKTSVPATAIPSYAANNCKDNQNAPLSARISSACSCIAPSTTSSVTTATPTATGTGSACALVSQLSASQKAASPSATPQVPARLAQECLSSVPLAKDAGLALVDALVPYIEWQSDLAWLKDPPSTYFYPPHDPLGYLAKVKSNLQIGAYANEEAFELDLYNVFAKAHDGHFVFYPDTLSNGLRWVRPTSLVSVSLDGISAPKIFLKNEISASPSKASAITKINGVDAVKYLEDFIFSATFNQDADAGYNTLFYSIPFAAAGIPNGYFSSGGRTRFIYPGDNTTYTFENGTSYTFGNVANVLGNWAGVVDGPSFFKKFAPGAAAALTIQAEEAPSSLQASAAVPGYPDAELLLPDLSIGGYYLNGTGFEDVAVLTSLSFEPDLPSDFQHLAETFFAEAKAAGKTKLVIDLSVNGGGYILQGYDLFRQLFPSIDQFGASRLRESETFIEAARAYSDAVGGDFDPNTSPDADLINIYETFLNYRYDLNITNQNFTSFAAKFGPVPLRGDEFTELIRWNFSDPITTINATWGMGMDITGYRSRQNFTQPFAAEDIIMLTDGYCASTCTLFAEFMRTQAGVKSIALGGRPEVQQIQAVGGVKGAQILSFGSIFSIAQTAIQYAGSNPVDALKKLSALPDRRSASNGINIRDNILPDNVNDGLPAQFSYEPADCRLYYTPEMIGDITATWKAAASAAFKGGKCNFGGLGKRGVERRVQRPRSAKVDKSKRREYKRVEVVRDRHWYVRHGKKVTEV